MSSKIATIREPNAMDPRENVDARRNADVVGWDG
jgi:hypothetical protein